MKTLFIGSIIFSSHILNEIILSDLELVGIVTKKKSIFNSDFFDLSIIAKKNKIPYIHTNNINSKKIFKWISDIKPNLIICVGWSQLLSQDILNIPKIGIIGYHPSSLPFNKGRHPIIWSLALGLKQTSSTFFLMDSKADCGNIISQKKIKILHKDNANTLYKKLIKASLVQINLIISQIKKGKLKSYKQNIKKGNSLRKRNWKDGQIDWRMSAINIYNLVRSLTKPYLGAHFIYKNKTIKVWEVIPFNFTQENIEPGKIYDKYRSLPRIKCGDGSVVLKRYEPKIKFQIGDYI